MSGLRTWACGRAAVAALVLAGGASPAAGGGPTRDAALTAAAERAGKIQDRFVRTWARYAVAAEWAHTDLPRAAELADRLESWTAKRDLLGVVMFAWGRKDPNAAAAWGLKFKERTAGPLEVRNAALHYAVVGMAAEHARLADGLIWKHLEEEGWGNRPRQAPMQAAREIAPRDPAFALAMAAKITHDGLRAEALRAVLRAWAARDPQAAREAFAPYNDKRFRESFDRDLADGWARKDARAAGEFAKTIADRRTRMMALTAVAIQLAPGDPRRAAELCGLALQAADRKWYEQLSRVAVAAGKVGEALAKADPRAAAEWAASLPGEDGLCRREAMDGVAAGWATKDAAAALAFYEAAEPGAKAGASRGTGAAWPALASELAETDAAALKLAERTDRLVLKSHIIHDVAVAVARRNPPAAADIVDKWAGATDYYGYRSGAASAIGSAWAAKDAKAAAGWASRLEPTRDRLAAIRAVGAAWVRRAPAEAGAWAAGLSDPQESVHALVGLAEGLRPEAAARKEQR